MLLINLLNVSTVIQLSNFEVKCKRGLTSPYFASIINTFFITFFGKIKIKMGDSSQTKQVHQVIPAKCGLKYVCIVW